MKNKEITPDEYVDAVHGESIFKTTAQKPVSGTKEWSSKSVNVQNGCFHNCIYCWARSGAIRFKRKTTDTWQIEEINETALNKSYGKTDGQVMYPTTHDITPDNVVAYSIVLRKLLSAGNDVLIVSKPHLECIMAICKEFEMYKDKILFRFSITSTDNEVLKYWEPNAPCYEERVECLKYAYSKGFKTSVSAEPMIDMEPAKLADQLLPFITDAIWYGKLNRIRANLSINGITDQEILRRADEITAWQSDEKNILKLYNRFKDNPKVRWKEKIKKVVGITIPTVSGLDI
jgi:DNA repair photolyase